MVISVTTKVIRRTAYIFEIKLYMSKNTEDDQPGYSPKLHINDRIVFQAMALDMKCDSVKLFVRFTKTHKNDKLDYLISTFHMYLQDGFTITKDFTTTDDAWHSVADEVKINYFSAVYTVKFVTNIAPLKISFKSIYEDTELTDFELRGVNGSVRMHKAVAASRSTFFKTLFMGSWRETAGGIVDVPETSVATLQHLKDYMYLGNIPEFDDLRQLLLLSSSYKMSDLELICAYEMSRHATNDETANDLIDFAVKHKQHQLLFTILRMRKYDILCLNAMKNFYDCC